MSRQSLQPPSAPPRLPSQSGLDSNLDSNLDSKFLFCSVSAKNTQGTETRMSHKRLVKDAITLAVFFGTVYVGALIGHGYGL